MKENEKNKREHSLNIGPLFDWIGRFITLLGFFGISGVVIYNSIKRNWEEDWWWIVIPVIVTFVLWISYHLCKMHYRAIVVHVLNLFAKKSPYSLKKWEIEYEYLSTTTMRFEAHFDVIAHQIGVDYIRVRYNWSGETEENPIFLEPITGDAYQTNRIEPDGAEFGYSFYKVFSNTAINEGDEPIKLGIRMPNLIEKEKKASPHLLTNINVPTEKLIMRVVLPCNINPSNIEFLEYIHATDDYHWHKHVEDSSNKNCPVKATISSNNKREIVWEVNEPIIGGKYIIRWLPRII